MRKEKAPTIDQILDRINEYAIYGYTTISFEYRDYMNTEETMITVFKHIYMCSFRQKYETGQTFASLYDEANQKVINIYISDATYMMVPDLLCRFILDNINIFYTELKKLYDNKESHILEFSCINANMYDREDYLLGWDASVSKTLNLKRSQIHYVNLSETMTEAELSYQVPNQIIRSQRGDVSLFQV